MPGSANIYLPDHPNADSLYAVKIARECGEEPFCIEAPIGWPGVTAEKLIRFIFRTYVEPGLDVSPAADEIIPDRIIRFARP